MTANSALKVFHEDADGKTATTPLAESQKQASLQDLKEQILDQIVRPISRPLDGVEITLQEQPLAVVLTQTLTNPQGRAIDYRYEIQIGGDRIELKGASSNGCLRQLCFPAPPYSPEQVVIMQDAFRAASIDHLNERFAPGDFKLTDYQENAVNAAMRDLNETGRSLIVIGTGGGKTQIIFEVLDRQFAQAGSPNDYKAIFVVNNNVILDEAGEKFVQRFGDKHSSSHLHGGERDLSGALLLTTPTSLAGGSRLQEACTGKKEVILVIDECHHTPADVLTKVIADAVELSQKEGFTLKIMGTTATETRPDLKSVLTFFNNEISYEMPSVELTKRGFLVPFRYLAHDAWLYPPGETPRLILPGDDIASDRKSLLNSHAAFEHVKAALDEVVLQQDDQRTLIIAPNVALAGEFVTYLSQFEEYKDRVVRLTSQEKGVDLDQFKETYEAWKRGDKGDANKPPPSIVVAVDLFKEGTDAPGIRNLVMWKDTNSLITFLQTLGRGLRPDEFKSHLNVIDVAGTFRKVHLLQWLGATTEKSASREGASQEKDRKDQSPHGFTGERPMCELAPEVTRVVNSFLSNVPALLSRRYPGQNYSMIPVEEILKLHSCVAERCGFDSTSSFEDFLKSEGEKLLQDSSATSVKALRDTLLPAFMTDPQEDRSGYQVLDRAPETMLVHAHLLEMLQVHVAGFTPTHFAPVFPELSKEALDQARVVAGNLTTLRRSCFDLDAVSMGRELIQAVVNPGKLTDDEFVRNHLILITLTDEECRQSFNSAEGRSISRERSSALPEHFDQLALREGYLKHPLLDGKLQREDFNLPRQEFESVLIQQALVKIGQDGRGIHRDYIKLIERKLRQLDTVLREGDRSKSVRALADVTSLLDRGSLLERFAETEFSPDRYRSLQERIRFFSERRDEYPALETIVAHLKQIEAAVTGLQESILPGSGSYLLRTSQAPGSRQIDVSLVIRTPEGAEEILTKTDFSVKTDLSRAHVVVESGALAAIDSKAESLPAVERRALARTLTSHLEKISDTYASKTEESTGTASKPIFILPYQFDATSGLSQGELCQAVLENSALEVLVGGPIVKPSSNAQNLEPSVRQVLQSRVSGIDESVIHSLRQQFPSSSLSFGRDLLHVYELLQFSRTQIVPHLEAWRIALKNTQLVSPSYLRFAALAAEPLERLMQPDTRISSSRFGKVRAYCSMLETIRRSGGLTDHLAVLTAAWSAWEKVYMGSFEQRRSPLLNCQASIKLLFDRLQRIHSDGTNLPMDLETAVNTDLEIIFNAFHEASRRDAVTFSSISEDDQVTYATTFTERLTSLATTLNELSEARSSIKKDSFSSNILQPERREGHPFFNRDNEAVYFLSGTTKKPVVHLDPNCAQLLKDRKERKKSDLPAEPTTVGMLEGIRDRSSCQCCPGCKTPSWKELDTYSDIKRRFHYVDGQSARLPEKLEQER